MFGQEPHGVISTPESRFHRETMDMIQAARDDLSITRDERQGFIEILVDIQEAGAGKLPLEIPLSEIARVW